MCIRYGRVNGRTRRSAGKSRDGAGASEGRESRVRIIERFYPKFPGWPSLVNSPAAVTGIEEAFLRKDAAPFPWGNQRFEFVFLQQRVISQQCWIAKKASEGGGSRSDERN